jgi:F-type H+-transporting ATPase subunit gamma
MESTQNLKKRLKSVGNIKKITKAMELVAATKMRKAQEVAMASRSYAFTALDLLANITLIEKSLGRKPMGKAKRIPLPALLQQRKIKKVLFVLIASDKGLAGSFNSSVFKKFDKFYTGITLTEEKFFVAVGEKSFGYIQKKGLPVLQKFVQAGDYTAPEQVQPLTNFIIDGYLEKRWDRVIVFSTHFTSALKQDPTTRTVLPVDFKHLQETVQELIPKSGKFAELIKSSAVTEKPSLDYLIEPSPQAVLENLARHLIFMQLYQLVLEANASEHSARRMAMKTASDNASDLSDTLNLQYNKSRQAAITKEIIEISAGAEALN